MVNLSDFDYHHLALYLESNATLAFHRLLIAVIDRDLSAVRFDEELFEAILLMNQKWQKFITYFKQL